MTLTPRRHSLTVQQWCCGLFDIVEISMSNTDTASAGSEKKAVADRQWIDTNGAEVDDPMLATGFRYLDLASKKAYVYQTGKSAAADRALAIFGGLTKAGNVRSTVTQKGEGADVIESIAAWFDELVDNENWAADRVGGGIRFNAEILAKAIAFVKNQHGENDHLPYLDKITSKAKVKDPGDKTGKKEITYAAFAYRNNDVKNRYHSTLPSDSAAPSVADL